jgi:hypothetical protein
MAGVSVDFAGPAVSVVFDEGAVESLNLWLLSAAGLAFTLALAGI